MTATLILMKGNPASGKSTLALALARKLRWPLIDKDDVKDHLYTQPQGNELSYQIMWQITGRQLSLQLSVIVDSPLSYPMAYHTGRELAGQNGADLIILEASPPDPVWRARLENRSASASAHKIRGWSAMQTQIQRYNGQQNYPIEGVKHLKVDTSRPINKLISEILPHITQQREY